MTISADRDVLIEDAISLLLHSLDTSIGGIDDGEHLHALAHATDGDGWNEPFSLHSTCECGTWAGVEWCQIDPTQSDRPTAVELLLAWRTHVTAALGLTEDHDLNTDGTLL